MSCDQDDRMLPCGMVSKNQDADPAACMLQSLIAPLVSAPECGRPENAACYTYTPDQRCTGRLASGGAVLGQSSNSTTAAVPPESSLVQRAHQRNLLVHGYTFRNEVSHPCMTVSIATSPHLVSCTVPVLYFSASILDCLISSLNITSSRQYVKALQASLACLLSVSCHCILMMPSPCVPNEMLASSQLRHEQGMYSPSTMLHHVQERFMAVKFAADPLAELTYYRRLGVDGVFVDCPSTAREWKVATGQLSAQPFSWVGTVISGPGTPFFQRQSYIICISAVQGPGLQTDSA